ncbi:MAG: hypothetical protein C4521_07470, partial [Actinobacteria bacterium]
MAHPRPSRRYSFLILLVVPAILAAFFANYVLASPGGKSPSGVSTQMQRAGRPDKPSKGLESRLHGLSKEMRRSPAAAREYARKHMLKLEGDRVIVVVEAGKSQAGVVREAIDSAGGKVLAVYRNRVKALLPVDKLESVNARADVTRVRPPIKPRPAETSEGVAETGADDWQAAGHDGSGTKVGIIDGGFIDYPDLLGTELPSTVTTWGASYGGDEDGGSEHGTAVAEIVHDMAPGASLYLARIEDDVELGLAKDWMKSQGVDVINHSMGWYGTEGGDGTGPINSIVNDAVANDIFWANSAGNDRQRHWMGDFTDTDADDYLNWDSSSWEINTFYAGAGWPIVGYLWWNDSWTNASQDYDFYLVYWNGSGWATVGGSEEYQDGSAGCTPVEAIGVYAPFTGLYGWVVERYDAVQTNVDFDLHSWYQDLDDPSNPNGHFFDYARSISVPADNPSSGFMSVGALGRAPGYTQEYYSSEGPTRDGRIAPEIAAPSDVENWTYGYFAGTSASSPHLAGAAAIIRSSLTTWTASEVEDYFESNAVDIGSPGVDNQSGSGRLDMPAGTFTPSGTMAVNSGASYATTTGVTINSSMSGATLMRIRNSGGAWSAWDPYAASTAWDLAGPDGTKLVEVEYKSWLGFVALRQDTIVLDTTPPSGTMAINSGVSHATTTAVTINSSVADADQMRFRDSGGSWTGWESYSSSRAWTLPSGDGTKTIEAEYRDVAGNVLPLSDDIVLDTIPPSGEMSIENEAAIVTTVAVSLDSTVTEAAYMRFRDAGGAWSSWEAYAAAWAWTLPAGEGSKTVEAEYRDVAGNVLSLSDDTLLDTGPPSAPGNFTAAGADSQVNLSWTEPPEGDFDKLRILRSESECPTSPTPGVGEVIAVDDTRNVQSFFDISLANGTQYYYSAFSRDLAGNWSTPATATATPHKDSVLTLNRSTSAIYYWGTVNLSGLLRENGTTNGIATGDLE